MAKKRSSGEGTISQLPSGSWRAQVSLRGKRISYTGKTQANVREWIRKTRDQIDQGYTYDDERTTVGTFLEGWLASKKIQVRSATSEHYDYVVHATLLPALGSILLRHLSPAHIQEFYDKLSSTGKKPQTVRITHVVLNMCLQHAKNLGLIARNPAEFVRVPKRIKTEMSIWDESQVNQFLLSIRGHRNENLYYMALGTGMRRGELLGLKWKDVDWIYSRVRIHRQVINPKGGGFFFQNPKTDKGLRNILLGPGLTERLRAQLKNIDIMRAFARDKWQDNDLVFPGINGKPQYGTNLSIEFDNLIKKSGLPDIRFHDCRHTAASIMLANGIHPMIVAGYLGHSMSTLMANYAHSLPDHQIEAANVMDEILMPIEIKFPQR